MKCVCAKTAKAGVLRSSAGNLPQFQSHVVHLTIKTEDEVFLDLEKRAACGANISAIVRAVDD
jgi:hypothetical protein